MSASIALQLRAEPSGEPQQLVLEITDDGCGTATETAGGGLAAPRDRAAALGGTLTISSAPGTGTRIEAVLAMRVLIADDSGIFRPGLRLLLEAAGVEVAADVADVPHLLRAVHEQHLAAAILDVRMPPTHTDEGIRAAADLRRQHPNIGVLVLSTYTDVGWAEQLLGDGRGGVGYRLKDRVDDVTGLLDALHPSPTAAPPWTTTPSPP